MIIDLGRVQFKLPEEKTGFLPANEPLSGIYGITLPEQCKLFSCYLLLYGLIFPLFYRFFRPSLTVRLIICASQLISSQL